MPTIITLTPNPAIDLWCEADAVKPIHKIRTFNEDLDPGGGGINVARVITALGGDVEAICLAGGVTGALLGELLDERGISHRLIPIAGRTRMSYTVHEHKSALEYRFIPSGPHLTEAELESCLQAVRASECRFFVASGSLPLGAPADFFIQVAEIVTAKGARFILDSSGTSLKETMQRAEVFLVKPSLSEIESLVGRKLDDPKDQDNAAASLVRDGFAKIVAVTLGGAGALLATAEGVLRMPSARVEARSTVGAGDSFLGAMTFALAAGRSYADALCYGVAGGAAAVLHPGTKLCNRADVDRIDAELRAAV